ncbi:MAG: lysozyme [Alphaproteobacteria bacterium]
MSDPQPDIFGDARINPALEEAALLAEDFEGLILEPYHDPVGYPTIGYGHLLSREPGADLTQWAALPDRDAALELLMKDMLRAAASVDRLIDVPLSVEQEAALIDFAFNCGSGNLMASTLRKVINRGEYADAPAQFRRWVFARGRKLAGLVRRREAEAQLWMAG